MSEEEKRLRGIIECARQRGTLIRETVLNGIGPAGKGKQDSQDKRRAMRRIPQTGKQNRNDLDKQTNSGRS